MLNFDYTASEIVRQYARSLSKADQRLLEFAIAKALNQQADKFKTLIRIFTLIDWNSFPAEHPIHKELGKINKDHLAPVKLKAVPLPTSR